MCGFLALLFIIVPALEIVVIIHVGEVIGGFATFGIIVATGIIGAALAKQQGMAAIREVQESLSSVQEIGTSMASAALLLVAGVCMITPGFITDISGFLLLIPPLRRLIAEKISEKARSRIVVMGGPHSSEDFSPPEEVIDVDWEEK